MEYTLCIIKPDAISKGFTGKIIDECLKAGFTIHGIRKVGLTRDQARSFYKVHEHKPFFEPLIAFMTSGPSVALVLKKENAIEDFRALMGETDARKAQKGTLRQKYGEDNRKNAVHGSDSPENAKKEIAFFFANIDLI
ncbi:MAG: nucleoside-diphosphate kinase [Candidatus Marinimicrobia bacterium]|nr:nucleoside-diphosphate kinase [Candidatus Neomarinimicrobiota bacterium]MDD5582627.1 nucleoside-diphosphate kinase [Candidatus Neomarinimicrobiota bacterium]